jgi:hypothetical protein
MQHTKQFIDGEVEDSHYKWKDTLQPYIHKI